jgi:hypothetical protein
MTNVKVVYKSTDPFYKDVLTIGKVYDAEYDESEPVYSSTGYYYTLKNDKGLKAQYYYGHFTELDKLRELKINDILV